MGPSETIDTARAAEVVVPTADWKTLASDATRRTLQAARGILQAQSSAETTTSGLGDSLQRIHALSSTETEVELAGASYFSQGAPSAAVSKGGQRRVPGAEMDARRPPGQDGRGGYDRLQQQAIWMVEMHPQPERLRSYCNADDHRRQQQHQQHHHQQQHQQQQHRLQPEVRDEFQDGEYSYYNSFESLEKYKDYFEEEFRESARHQQQVAMTQQHAENERGNSRQRCDGLESRKQRREKINDAYHEGPYIYLFIYFIYYFIYFFYITYQC